MKKLQEEKMEITVTYVFSQIFTILMYILLAISYYAKNRKSVLILGFLSVIANGIAYILLKAYTGLAMCIVALIRNMIFVFYLLSICLNFSFARI